MKIEPTTLCQSLEQWTKQNPKAALGQYRYFQGIHLITWDQQAGFTIKNYWLIDVWCRKLLAIVTKDKSWLPFGTVWKYESSHHIGQLKENLRPQMECVLAVAKKWYNHHKPSKPSSIYMKLFGKPSPKQWEMVFEGLAAPQAHNIQNIRHLSCRIIKLVNFIDCLHLTLQPDQILMPSDMHMWQQYFNHEESLEKRTRITAELARMTLKSHSKNLQAEFAAPADDCQEKRYEGTCLAKGEIYRMHWYVLPNQNKLSSISQ